MQGGGELHTGFWWGNLEERGDLEDPGIDWRIILKWISRKWDWRHGLDYPLDAELNPVCHLLALLGGYHILHVFRIGVKLRLFRKSKKI